MKTKADLDALIPTLVELLQAKTTKSASLTMSKMKMAGASAMTPPPTTSAMRKMAGSSK